MMALVVVAAIECAFWTSLYKCEARRPLMYQQRDVTRAIMLEAQQDIAAAGHSTAEIRNERPRGTYSYEWTEWLEAWEIRGGQKRPLIRAAVSGNDGQFALEPILVETYGSPLDAPWLDRLLRAYREKGWPYRVVQAPDSEYFGKRQEWIEKEKWMDQK